MAAGTTWLQGICAALVFQAPEPPVPQDELSPWLDALFAPLDAVLGTLEGLTSRRYIKTHLPLDGIVYHENVKYIVVGRDGRDVFMSMWNHWNNMQPAFIDQLNDAPGATGPRLHHPPSDLRAAFDEWLSRGSFEWEEDGYPFWSHLHHARDAGALEGHGQLLPPGDESALGGSADARAVRSLREAGCEPPPARAGPLAGRRPAHRRRPEAALTLVAVASRVARHGTRLLPIR
jgi:hypothetical protein